MAPSLFHVVCTWIVLLVTIHTSLAKPLCHPDESSALMEFKASFITDKTDPDCVYPKAESWSQDGRGDCCSWDGVECDKATGYVTSIDLSNSCLFGTISSNTSLFRLLHLESLNLAQNDFNYSSIPYGFGNLSRLHYFNLSSANFSGKIPSDISRLSRLISLNLSYGSGLEMPHADHFLRNLTMLEDLDLSGASIASPLPHVMANFSSLKSLKLRDCGLSGEFPTGLFLLPNLEVLDIKYNSNLSGFIPELHWGSRLKSLSLDITNFSGGIPFSIGNLILLNELSIRDCYFSGSLPSSLSNLSQLAHLDISLNEFHGQVPASFANLTQLSYVDFSMNNFTGESWHWLVSLSKITTLYLSDCQLSGSFPSSFDNLTRLIDLDLSSNNLEGEIPNSLGELKHLEFLRLGWNNLSGTVDLHKLKNLKSLYLDSNNISLDSKTEMNVMLPNLSTLSLRSCNLREFPKILGHLRGLEWLDLSHNKIERSLPSWMGNQSKEIPNSVWELKNLEFLDLSWNNLSGTVDLHKLKNLEILYLDSNNNISFVTKTEMNAMLPNLSIISLSSCNLREFPKILDHLSGLQWLDLSHNKIKGSLPTWMGNGSKELLEYLDLSHNFLTSFVNNRIDMQLPKLSYFDISSNSLKMELPTPPPSVIYYNISNNFLFGELQSICRAKSLNILDLYNNSLNGTIPSCLGNTDSLPISDLGKNKVEGMFNHAYPNGCELVLIDLRKNRLQGPLPRSLVNCTKLVYLNLGYNEISDEFPLWLSELIELKVVILKSNNFHGPIETYQSRFNFSSLHIIDLSENSFNGELPLQMFQSFHAMKVLVGQERLEYMMIREWITSTDEQYFTYGMNLMNKGTEREYLKVPYAFMLIDLSNNKFEGRIPDLIGDLEALLVLNLSNNALTGSIRPSLANLTRLESLDLSQNKLSGEIPQQLARLTFLSIFNVSHNQLSGPIPQGSQFSTFPTDSFSMNEELCGSPLPKKCTSVGNNSPSQPSPSKETGGESPFNLDWKVVLIGNGVGFFIGFLIGNLIIDEKSGWFLYYSKEMAKRWNRLRRH